MSKITDKVSSVTGSRIKIEMPEHDVAGEEVDPVAFAVGEREHMVTYIEERKESKGKIVTIAINSFVSAGIGKKTILNRGACVMSIINLLKVSGYETRIVVVNHSSSDSYHHSIYTEVQKEGEYIDEDVIAFVMCHPSFFRRITFSIGEHYESDHVVNSGFRSSGSYGSPASLSDIVEADILFDKIDLSSYKDIKCCSDKVIAMLKACPNVDIKFNEGES